MQHKEPTKLKDVHYTILCLRMIFTVLVSSMYDIALEGN